MIDSQAGDARDGRFDEDVCAIVFPADAALDDRRIDSLAHVRVICHEGQEPEVGRFGGQIRRQALGSRSILQTIPCFEEVSGESFLSQGLVIDLDTFAHKSEVG